MNIAVWQRKILEVVQKAMPNEDGLSVERVLEEVPRKQSEMTDLPENFDVVSYVRTVFERNELLTSLPMVERGAAHAGVQSPRLRPDEWSSGEHLWIIDMVGDPQGLSVAIKQLQETVWQGEEVKVAVTGGGGGREVRVLDEDSVVARGRR